MADLGIIFLRRRYPIHWYQSSYIFITGSMPFRYFWATLYTALVQEQVCTWDIASSFVMLLVDPWYGWRCGTVFGLCKTFAWNWVQDGGKRVLLSWTRIGVTAALSAVFIDLLLQEWFQTSHLSCEEKGNDDDIKITITFI